MPVHHSPTAIAPEILHHQSVAAVARLREMGATSNPNLFSTRMPAVELVDLTTAEQEAADPKKFAGRFNPGSGLLSTGQSPFHADGSHLSLIRWGKDEDQCGKIDVDHSTTLSECSIISAIGVSVGKGVLFGPGVILMDCLEGPANQPKVQGSPFCQLGKIVIEDHCWVGYNVLVMPGVTIGHHATIGGGSVVTKDVPAHGVAAGNPAKLLKVFD